MKYGILIDITRCIGCYACEEACAKRWGNPITEDHKLSSIQNTAVIDYNGVYVSRLCMHCEKPTCASACPVGAFQKTSLGPVIYDPSKCLGCRYCMQACPFDIPKYQWNKLNPKVTKCDMCYERIKAGDVPACVEACPAEARTFGKRDELIEEARRRINENPETYYPHIFGIKEVGGTSVIYLSDRPMQKFGFKANFPEVPLSLFTEQIMSKIPGYIFWGGTLLFGIWWITKRRDEVQRLQKKLKEMEENNKKENEK
ncbi:MAG: 4Fe-4S dicluster domain-containing protein [Candidatus Kryptonium sp.]